MDWHSFFDIATPDHAAKALTEMYGEGAKLAAVECAWQAREDGRPDDYRFWIVVLCRLYGVRVTLH